MWVRNHRQRNRPARSSEYKRLVHVIGGDAYAHESLAPHVTGMRLIMESLHATARMQDGDVHRALTSFRLELFLNFS